jgi:hypothetical protein
VGPTADGRSAADRGAARAAQTQRLANIRLAAIQAWEGTSTDNQQAREFAWLTVKVVGRIEAELQSIIDNGLIAARRVQAPVR